MRLKYAITIGDPKSASLVEYQARTTSSSHLTKADIVASLGMVQARYPAGLALTTAGEVAKREGMPLNKHGSSHNRIL